jgi:ADP-heptose:LPS heptosyltransferase
VERVLERLPPSSRIAVIRLRSLGDCVLTTPALAILRRARPDLRISVVVEPRWRAIFEDSPDVDDLLPPALGPLRRARPHLCLNLHGGRRSAWMTALSGARYRAGFAHFRHRFAYNVPIPRAQEILNVERTVHTAEHLASAVFYLGAPLCEIPRARLTAQGKAPSSAIIHPVAATAAKTWPSARFLQVAARLRASGSDVLFIGGPGDDLSPFRDFPVLAGTPLARLKTVLASASLFIGNDSGPAHIAAAFGVPSVVIFGPSEPTIWGPWRTPSEVVAAPGGIASITVEQVLAALARLRVAA